MAHTALAAAFIFIIHRLAKAWWKIYEWARNGRLRQEWLTGIGSICCVFGISNDTTKSSFPIFKGGKKPWARFGNRQNFIYNRKKAHWQKWLALRRSKLSCPSSQLLSQFPLNEQGSSEKFLKDSLRMGDRQILLNITAPFPIIRTYRRTPRVAIKHHILVYWALNEVNYALPLLLNKENAEKIKSFAFFINDHPPLKG
jgi:hypothetical protein